MNVKRIAAIIGIVLFACMFLVFILSAFFAKENSNSLFLASMFSIIVIPIVIWWFMIIYKWVHKNDIPRSTDDQNNTEAEDGTKNQ
jgi:putative hydrolase of the HAD superfamily